MNFSAIRFIYFDIDDTLLNHSAAAEGALRGVHDEFSSHIGHIPAEKFIERFHIENSAVWLAMARRELTADEVKIHRFTRTLAHLTGEHPDALLHIGKMLSHSFLDRYGDYFVLHEAAEEVIEAAERLAPVGLLSNGFPEQQRRKLRYFGWEKRFAAVVLSADAGAMKPDKAIFDFARMKAGIDDAETLLYVGDNFETDVVGAANAGWQVVWVNHARQDAPENSACLTVDSLAELLAHLR